MSGEGQNSVHSFAVQHPGPQDKVPTAANHVGANLHMNMPASFCNMLILNVLLCGMDRANCLKNINTQPWRKS